MRLPVHGIFQARILEQVAISDFITFSNFPFPLKEFHFFPQLLRWETSQIFLTSPISSYLLHLSFPPPLSTALSRYQLSAWHVQTILLRLKGNKKVVLFNKE